MDLRWHRFITFLTLSVFPHTALATFTVTEVMYNPHGSDSGYEWIEVTQSESERIPVDSVHLIINGVWHDITSTGTGFFPPRKPFVIAQDKKRFRSNYPEYPGPLFLSPISLPQSGTIQMVKDGARDPLTRYHSDHRSDNTGATLHRVEESFVAAPATPGLLAINPIPNFQRESPQLQQQLPLKAITHTEVCPPTHPTVVQEEEYPDRLLTWIASALTIIALELGTLLLVLIRRTSETNN